MELMYFLAQIKWTNLRILFLRQILLNVCARFSFVNEEKKQLLTN